MASVVLVTGAAGFIGKAIVRQLADAGLAVRAGVRRTSLQPSLAERPEVASVRCDLADAASVAAAVDGVATVIHAAYGDVSRMLAEMNLLLQWAEAGMVGRIVFLSSIAVYGRRDGHVVEDTAPLEPIESYGEAKAAVEAKLVAWADRTGRCAVILRPGVVYGVDSPLWFDGIVARLAAGAIGPLGAGGDGTAPLVHVEDVAAAVVLAVAPEAPCRLVANLVGPETLSWNVYFERVRSCAGLPLGRPLGPLSLRVRYLASLPAKLANRAVGGRWRNALILAPSPCELELFARRVTYATERARAELGWTPRLTLAEGLTQR